MRELFERLTNSLKGVDVTAKFDRGGVASRSGDRVAGQVSLDALAAEARAQGLSEDDVSKIIEESVKQLPLDY